MQVPASILSAAELNSLGAGELIAWCAQTGLSASDASNAVALQIARDYLAGKLDYVVCDRIMNSLMNAVTTQEFLAVSDRTIPRQLISVYQAFDAGEYVHADDVDGENQEEKYTRPMLISLLAHESEA
jgi:hypothetical protein